MGIKIDPKTLSKNIENLDESILDSIHTVFDYFATRAASEMRSNATWTDRTGNARNGLTAKAEFSGEEANLVLYHTMPYGLWLEVRWSGRYAILGPTLRDIGPRLMTMLSQVVLQSSRPA